MNALGQQYRKQFPCFNAHPNLVYLDSCATSQKPQMVIDAISKFYSDQNANVHGGIHRLSAHARIAYEATREKTADFLSAKHANQIIFTSGATASLNTVAQAAIAPTLKAGDEIIISSMEHHSNIVPWQYIAQQTGAHIKEAKLDETGQLDLIKLSELISDRSKVLAITHMSNVTGIINPIKCITELCHDHGMSIVVDGTQMLAHQPVDVADLGCDFYIGSAHKMYGPTGVGLLYVAPHWLDRMHPWSYGGGMISHVSIQKSQFAPAPHCFEAGTPHIAGIVGLNACLDFMNTVDMQALKAYENSLYQACLRQLKDIPMTILGDVTPKGPILSFTIPQCHAHDLATCLDVNDVASRAGHHCTIPLHDHFNVTNSLRVSFAIYNTQDDVDAFVDSLRSAYKRLA